MEKGDELFAQGDYEASLGQYQAALSSIPDAPLAKDWKSLAEAKFADCSVTVAREKAKDGRYSEANDLVEGALLAIPDHSEAKRFQKHLADPDRWPPALTPQHVENVKAVQKTLWLGHSAYEIGDYDASNAHYQDVLRIDPYNTAARRGMEKVEMKKSEYYDSARDQQRSRMLNQVNEAWEDKVPTKALVVSQEFGSGKREGAYLTEKMNQIIFPTVQFAGATIEEAIEYLRVKSRDLDEYEPDPSKKGVNIILRTGDAPISAQISLDLKDVPMVEALRYITELAGMKYKVESFAVLVVPLSDTNAEQNTRMYKVPPDFLSMGGGSAAPAAASADPFASTASASTGSALIQRQTALEILSSQGIPFPEGASAVFNPVTSQLIVKNTQPNLDLVETFVNSLINQAPKQISIAAKFVEVSQRNTDELGFDWFLGSVGVNANNVFLGGGTAGNTAATGVGFPTFPGGFGAGALNNVSRGVRSGGTAVSADSVDGAIAAAVAGVPAAGGASNLAPGIFSVAGIFTDPQFATIVRGLSQQKGTDLMSAPSVTTKSGQRATVQVVREFIYPTEFDPPQLPQGNAGGIAGGTTSLIATPTTPTAFEMRPVGVTMEVDPVVGADGYTIDLNLAPEVVEFDGFINYGSPINAPGVNPITGLPTSTPITQNVINQPVFSIRKVQTSVTVWDGQTVALGGLIREDVEDVEDGIPLLQDLPFIGRLFQTKVEDHFKRNLMIFVTAKLIDPSGQPIRIQSSSDASSENPLLPAIGAP